MAAGQGGRTTRRIDGEMLAAIAAGLAAADPAQVLPAGSVRRWAQIAANEAYSAWVIAWPAGTGLGLHDHQGSAAVVHVVSGHLRERYLDGFGAVRGDVVDAGGEPGGSGPGSGGRGDLVVRWLEEGSTTLLPSDHEHEVVNVGVVEAISVHVYSPPLQDTSFRDDPEIDLR